ncbi:MAG: serine hydrolase domain-containing protein [Actinomycetota bacterium]
MTVEGTCDERFAGVREEFERNLAERGEVGAAACVTVDGETVVDLWGGVADPATGREWERDTIGLVFSCTKGATALCAHMLVARGELDLDAPVTKYWPEFGKGGKEEVNVRVLLSHQAGLAAIREAVPEDGLCDWDLVVGLLADQEPLWEPGTRQGYHALTFGHLVGEVVRRITGRSLGTFFREEVAAPLGLDFWIGLPEEHEARIAPTIPADEPGPGDPIPDFYVQAMTDPTSIPGLVLMNSGGILFPGAIDRSVVYRAEIPAVNGVANARALAGMYRPLALGGSVDGVRLLDEATILEAGRVASATAIDATLGVPTRWSLGFMKAVDNRRLPGGIEDSVLTTEDALGHCGMGGSVGYADAPARLSFGYTMSKQGGGIGMNHRGQALVDQVYRTLGYRRPDGGGIWYRPH